MKKILVILILVVISISFASCISPNNSTSSKIFDFSTSDKTTAEQSTESPSEKIEITTKEITTVAVTELPTEKPTQKPTEKPTQAPTQRPVSSIASSSSQIQSSQTVYITPSGKRYHYLSTCGGKNSYEVSIDNVRGRTPCQKCVH